MVIWNKTKIIATIGPASEGASEIGAMLRASADIFRINGAHGSLKNHSKTIARIRGVAKRMNVPAAIMVDLPGPKYRLGRLSKESILVKKGDEITLTCGKGEQTDSRIPVPCEINRCLKKGDQIFINDGIVGLTVSEVRGKDVRCVVHAGGELRSKKGINLPGVRIEAPSLTAADKKILDFAIRENADFVCLSFVRSAKNIADLKRIIKRRAPHIRIIAKIEKPEALKDLDNIINAADAVMIARGDLGIEMPFSRLPIIQRNILKRCMAAGKPAITATQMLESMVASKRPTRAEATDVAEAVWGGSDAIMLSEETSIGISPSNAVAAMAKIALEAETQMPSFQYPRFETDPNALQAQIIAEAAALIAERLHARAIVTPTRSGRTPLFVSRQRRSTPILAPTAHPFVARRMCLYWGVRPMIMKDFKTVDEMLAQAEKVALRSSYIRHKDTIVITSGAHGTKNDVTRLVEVRRI